MLRPVLVVFVILSMIATVSARPPEVTQWRIPFTGSIDVRLHAQTSAPLQNAGFNIAVTGNIPYMALYENKITVMINHQDFVIYQTDQCCYEGPSLFTLNMTASMIFHVSTTVPWNGTFVLVAWVG